MITQRTKLQLVAFAVISVVSLIYALIRFTDVAKAFGEDIYTVNMQMKDSGGIFSNAEVTYRGMNVGRVGELKLAKGGLIAQLNIEPDMPPIPADTQAVVMNRSAIGEQFVDLRPRKSGGPYLRDGSKISRDDVTLPPETAEVIQYAHDFAASVPTESLRTVVDESYDAFNGTGDDLRRLMDNSTEFVEAARENLPETVELLDSGSQVLDAVNDERGNIKSYSKDLKNLSATLKSSDGDIRKLIDETPETMKETSELIHEVGPGLSSLLANAITIGNLTDVNLEGLEMALQLQPALSATAVGVLREDPGRAPLGLTANVFEPPPCVKGYEDTKRRTGTETSETRFNKDAYCAEPQGSETGVRGAQNAPKPR